MKLIQNIFVGSLLFLAYSCGRGNSDGTAPVTDSNRETMDVPITFTNADSAESGYGLELASTAASSYVMSLTGCKSGLSGNITTSTVKLYVGDSGCLIKLSSFRYNGNTYVPKT